MRNIYALAMAGMLLASCTGEKNSVLTGEIEGLESDTVLLFTRDMVKGKFLSTDTIAVKDGKFAMTYSDSTIYNVQIVEKPKGNKALRMPRNMGIVLLPGDEVNVKGAIGDWKISGSELYDGMNSVTPVLAAERDYKLSEDEILKLYSAPEKDEQAINALKVVLKNKSLAVNAAKMEYISANPGSIVSAYYSIALKAEDGLKACQLLSTEVRNGAMKEIIDHAEESYKNYVAREEAKKNVQPGKPAPDFKLKNLDNEMMTLASFKGKYMILDFWGTRCGWCIKGMPRMKEYYAKYKEKVEIVGVNCRDTEDKWRKGVAQHQLPWVNLYNGNDTEIVTKYAVPGFPTKVLIDPDGIIVGVFVGESDDMYNKLDELFK